MITTTWLLDYHQPLEGSSHNWMAPVPDTFLTFLIFLWVHRMYLFLKYPRGNSYLSYYSSLICQYVNMEVIPALSVNIAIPQTRDFPHDINIIILGVLYFLLYHHKNKNIECDLFIITFVRPNILHRRQEAFYNYLLL